MFGLSRRLDDHMAAERERNAVQQDQHRELREQVKDLSEQTRAEFKVLRADTEARHKENRTLLRTIAVGVLLAIVTYYLNRHVAGAR
jgi:hypothetical protein